VDGSSCTVTCRVFANVTDQSKEVSMPLFVSVYVFVSILHFLFDIHNVTSIDLLCKEVQHLPYDTSHTRVFDFSFCSFVDVVLSTVYPSLIH
jgi:hypothetical protein